MVLTLSELTKRADRAMKMSHASFMGRDWAYRHLLYIEAGTGACRGRSLVFSSILRSRPVLCGETAGFVCRRF